MKLLAGLLLLGSMTAGLACDYPDEGTMPLHRAVKRIELIPEIDDWTRRAQERGAIVYFTVKLDHPVRVGRRCYWTMDVETGGRLEGRFYVSPDGRHVRADGGAGRPVRLAEWLRRR